MSDNVEVEVLEDGTLKFSTDKISGANHANAEAFLAEVGRMLGGKVERRRKQGTARQHTHEHAHEGHGYSH